MAETVLMPKAGISVESCLIGTWKKKAGDSVKIGDILFDYETDKATFECESTADGVLLEIFYADGDEVAVLKPVCAVGSPGEDVSSLRPGGAGSADAGAAGGGGSATSDGSDAASVATDGGSATGDDANTAGGANAPGAGANAASGGGFASAADGGSDAASGVSGNGTGAATDAKVASGGGAGAAGVTSSGAAAASPRAKALAGRFGLDIGAAIPTGPSGRIIERDIRSLDRQIRQDGLPAQSAAGKASAAAATGSGLNIGCANPAGAASGVANPASAASGGAGSPDAESKGYYDEKLSKIRSLIAESMLQSLQNTAQLTHHHSFDASAVLAFRSQIKNSGDGGGTISIGDMILYGVARTLKDYPALNSHFLDNTLRRFTGVHLGVAVDTPRGLMVPTIFDADKKSLSQISAEVKTLAEQARSGSINPDKLRGATFTVSNLGPTGVESFTPIINPPQVAILGVCGTVTKVRQAHSGIETYPSIGLSLTYDHRAVDGAPASRFAQVLCRNLEQFTLLLALG
ncbi:MAG: 2-oxo acid dehydrogenase subunit E2 [Clostridiales Family XIII bacterium]|jgi:pyruvate dehydrogenase E2 component (dihydrolipoamide acetyltransferase)|nr:2-oxo acid dehydrogenase subunit E2 [Clostridiales Family XIII bacterium]